MLSPSQTCDRLYSLIEQGAECGFDTEGLEWMTCCGFATRDPATNRYSCLVVDTLNLKGTPHASDVWAALRAVIESPRVRKVCWAADHERAFLQLRHQIVMQAYDDAMFAWHELYPELPKGLKYAASLLTHIPCWTEGISWKDDDDRPAASGKELWAYNSLDCISTLKLWHHAKLRFAHTPITT